MKIDTDKMKIYDISMAIHHDMPVYKGRDGKRPIITVDADFQTGSHYESRLEMNLHTGTHIDRSLHMIPDGTTVESLSLEQMVGPCTVIDLSHAVDKITKEDLMGKDIRENTFVLIKTRNSFEDILEKDFIYVDREGAKYLKEKGIIGVGIDSLGIERAQPDHETHIELLCEGIVILEGLVLKDIDEGEYFLSAVPILVNKVEAAPVRAYLIKN